MRIIILSSRFPYPLEKGDKLRLYQQIKVLSKHFEIVLCALVTAPVDLKAIEALKKYCAEVQLFQLTRWRFVKNFIPAIMGGMPIQVAYFYERKILKQLQAYVKKMDPDLVYCQLIRMAPYVRGIEADYPCIIDFMDSFYFNTANHPEWPYLFSKIEQGRVASYENSVASLFKAHFVISERDRKYFGSAIRDEIILLPNGVDTNYWKPLDTITTTHDLSFCGNLGYGPNREALAYITHLVHSDPGGLSVIAAGANAPTAYLHRSNKQLTVLGWVEDLREVYQQGRVFIAPIFSGSGTQNKVLEAMAQGMACVVTGFVNEAIMARNGHDLLVADSLDEFRTKVAYLLGHPDERKNMGANAREFVKQNYDWVVNTSNLVEKIELSSRS